MVSSVMGPDGHHHPDDPGRGERLGERGERRHVGDLRPRVVPDHLVTAFAQALPHVEAHLAQADQTQLHVQPPSR